MCIVVKHQICRFVRIVKMLPDKETVLEQNCPHLCPALSVPFLCRCNFNHSVRGHSNYENSREFKCPQIRLVLNSLLNFSMCPALTWMGGHMILGQKILSNIIVQWFLINGWHRSEIQRFLIHLHWRFDHRTFFVPRTDAHHKRCFSLYECIPRSEELQP